MTFFHCKPPAFLLHLHLQIPVSGPLYSQLLTLNCLPAFLSHENPVLSNCALDDPTAALVKPH